MRIRSPRGPLRLFVDKLWAMERTSSPAAADREAVLPTGTMHIAFRLSASPFRLFEDANDAQGRTVGHAVVGGARAAPYLRDLTVPALSVGAQLRPGASWLLFGVPANELAGRHTPLDELWGPAAAEARQRLLEAGSPDGQLDVLESLLAARLPVVRGIHPAVAQALEMFMATADVGLVVERTATSHRRFILLFRRTVGLTPKLYCRVLRFQRVLERLTVKPAAPCVDLALDAGYSDQQHFVREFTGFTPGAYRAAAPARPHHVPILGPER